MLRRDETNIVAEVRQSLLVKKTNQLGRARIIDRAVERFTDGDLIRGAAKSRGKFREQTLCSLENDRVWEINDVKDHNGPGCKEVVFDVSKGPAHPTTRGQEGDLITHPQLKIPQPDELEPASEIGTTTYSKHVILSGGTPLHFYAQGPIRGLGEIAADRERADRSSRRNKPAVCHIAADPARALEESRVNNVAVDSAKEPQDTACSNVNIRRDGARIINNERRGVVDVDACRGNRAIYDRGAVAAKIYAVVYSKYIIDDKPAAVDVRRAGNGEIGVGDQGATTAEIKVAKRLNRSAIYGGGSGVYRPIAVHIQKILDVQG